EVGPDPGRQTVLHQVSGGADSDDQQRDIGDQQDREQPGADTDPAASDIPAGAQCPIPRVGQMPPNSNDRSTRSWACADDTMVIGAYHPNVPGIAVVRQCISFGPNHSEAWFGGRDESHQAVDRVSG